MKKIYRAMAGIILALLLAIGLASLFTTGVGSDGADTSKPQFSMQALLDGTFISKLETWYTNTFPMRDTLLKANRWLNGFYHSSARRQHSRPRRQHRCRAGRRVAGAAGI